MQKYRKLDPRIWDDEAFEQLSPQDKLLAIYVLTGSHTNRIGIFKFKVGAASEDLGLPTEAVRNGLERVCEAFGWEYDPRARVCYLPTWWRYNKPKAKQNITGPAGAMADFHDIPDCELKEKATRNVEETLAQWGWFLDKIPHRGHSGGHSPGHSPGIAGGIAGGNGVHPGAGTVAEAEAEREMDDESSKVLYFDIFWKHYPHRLGRKRGRGVCERLFREMTEQEQEQAAGAAERYAREVEPEFAKYAANWLEAEDWRDYLEDLPDGSRGPKPPTREEVTERVRFRLIRAGVDTAREMTTGQLMERWRREQDSR